MSDVRSVWPLLRFDPQWNESRYDFGELVALQRLEDDEREAARKFIFDCYGSCRTPALDLVDGAFVECDWQTDFRWILVVHVAQRELQRPMTDTGVDFLAAVEEDVKNVFLRAMRVAMPAAVSAPLILKATLHPHFALDQKATNDVSGTWPIEKSRDSYRPLYYTKRDIGHESLCVLQDIWSAFRFVHNLDRWTELVTSDALSELLFSQISNRAFEATQHGNIEEWASVFNEFTYPPMPYERVVALLRALKENSLLPLESPKDEEEKKGWYRAAFRAIFHEMRRDFIANQSRVGRALDIFDTGLALPAMHTFLSACLALELLFNTESEGVTAQIALRFAKLLGNTAEEAMCLDQEMRRVYRARSALVHGRKAFEDIKSDDVRQALQFARRSLQRILSNVELTRLFGERTSKGKEQRLIRDYFNGIIFAVRDPHGNDQAGD